MMRVVSFVLALCLLGGCGSDEQEAISALKMEVNLLKLKVAELEGALQRRKDKKKLPVVSAPPPKTRAPADENSLSDIRQRAFSDDATSVEEAFFHAAARAAVVMNVQPNKLRVGGSEFRVKRSPFPEGGAFVYDPRTTFHGVTRNLVWWVPSYEAAKKNRAYPLNSPSKMVTPGLEFPLRAGLSKAPSTSKVLAYVFP